jgi:hypothetical protein
MHKRLFKENMDMAKALATDLGDQLIESRAPLEIKIATTALLHASICYTHGLDIHDTMESVMAMYKDMQKNLGKK